MLFAFFSGIENNNAELKGNRGYTWSVSFIGDLDVFLFLSWGQLRETIRKIN